MSKKSRRVAIMLDLKWPYKRHADIFAGTQAYALEQGWHSIIDEFVIDTLARSSQSSLPYNGVIARVNHALLKESRRLRIPLVNVWHGSPVRNELPGVYPDFRLFGQQLAEHLLLRGFRSFATITSDALAQQITVDEFVRVVQDAGFHCSKERIPQDPQRNLGAWHKTQQVIKHCITHCKLPVGLYTDREDVGRLVAQLCQEDGLRVPIDVAIIAGQNETTLCENPRPSLTSLEMSFERVGYEAARLLHRLMDGGEPPKRPVIVPSIGLVVRESTDFFAVEDESVAAALQFIATNSQRPIGPNEVAQAIKVEIRTLQTRFSKHLNRTISSEIRRVRIERAKRELSNSKKRLSAIARDVGLGNSTHMCEVFQRELGVSPREYRNQMRT